MTGVGTGRWFRKQWWFLAARFKDGVTWCHHPRSVCLPHTWIDLWPKNADIHICMYYLTKNNSEIANPELLFDQPICGDFGNSNGWHIDTCSFFVFSRALHATGPLPDLEIFWSVRKVFPHSPAAARSQLLWKLDLVDLLRYRIRMVHHKKQANIWPWKENRSQIRRSQARDLSTWWLIPRIVSGLVHPSYLRGRLAPTYPIKKNQGYNQLTHLRFVGSSPPSRYHEMMIM